MACKNVIVCHDETISDFKHILYVVFSKISLATKERRYFVVHFSYKDIEMALSIGI